MKAVSVVASLVGLTLIAALVIHFGAAPVARSLLAVGIIGFGAVCLIHLALIALMGIAWWILLPGTKPWAAIWARLVRNSASEVLPLSQVGGYVLGARALNVAGVSGSEAAASTIVDVSLEFFAQLAYIAIALFWLLQLDPHAAGDTAGGHRLGCGHWSGGRFSDRAMPGVQASRIVSLTRSVAAGRSKWWPASVACTLQLLRIYARPAGIWASFALHLVCWIAAAGEIWLALRFMGRPRGFGVVLVIESLLYAVRSIAFAVPNAFGVQEGAYIVLGAGFGLAPDVTLALSLMKRARDFAIGVPALGIYQLIESGRLWHLASSTITRPLSEVKPRP